MSGRLMPLLLSLGLCLARENCYEIFIKVLSMGKRDEWGRKGGREEERRNKKIYIQCKVDLNCQLDEISNPQEMII